MKFNNPLRLADAAAILECEYIGDPEMPILGLNEIHLVEEGDITFVDHPKYYDRALKSKATFILINQKVDCPEGKGLIISDDPFTDFNRLIRHHRRFVPSTSAISETAVIGEGTVIQPGVFIGHHVSIGKNCLIHANAVIYDHTEIGDNVIIHGNTVIGSDAFYHQRRTDKVIKFESCGRVIIENDVEIGACCTIDKGVTGDTVIGSYSRFDNNIHIGHDVRIGKRCLFAASVVVGGISVIEDDVICWGQVAINKTLTIGKGAVILATSAVGRDVEAGKVYFGVPAIEAKKKWRELSYISKLPEMFEMLSKFQKSK
ncbi:MAG: UDP-3-O-(3-hydroxymyristoyl)glucosamine N-acyltransferase [Bacteroidales bacterium]|nr:UDP-3-O-(3-hydroxymyristoyl)glucosamine N-acyltransferase [Bacteroidales bacterium]